jgi:hypothetical protein
MRENNYGGAMRTSRPVRSFDSAGVARITAVPPGIDD